MQHTEWGRFEQTGKLSMIFIETNMISNGANLSLNSVTGGDMEWQYLVNSHQGFSSTKSQLTRTRPTAIGMSQVVSHTVGRCVRHYLCGWGACYNRANLVWSNGDQSVCERLGNRLRLVSKSSLTSFMQCAIGEVTCSNKKSVVAMAV